VTDKKLIASFVW